MGTIFHLESSTNLTTNGWTLISPCLQSTSGALVVAETIDFTLNSRFYRLIEEPLESAPPFLINSFPADGDILGSVTNLSINFDECMNPASYTGFSLEEAGLDGILGTADDSVISLPIPLYAPATFSFLYTFTSALPPGYYKGTVQAPLSDLSGNLLTPVDSWKFHVLPQSDLDNDGIPDISEPSLGLDPNDPDTDNNGVPDGQEDWDGDGLPNNLEALIGTDPADTDTDADGWQDGQEDADMDGLSNLSEHTGPTDILIRDSDTDGFQDGMEAALGSDPSITSSTPDLFAINAPTVLINPALIRSQAVLVNAGAVFLATPPVTIQDSLP